MDHQDAAPTPDEIRRWYERQHLALKRSSSRKTLEFVCRWWTAHLPAQPTAQDVHRILSEQVQAGQLSATTANMRRRVLNRMYEVARLRWPLLVNIAHNATCPKIPEPRQVPRGLVQPYETWPRLLAALPGPEGKFFAAVQRRMGLRVGEARGLEPGHILWREGKLAIVQQREPDKSTPAPLKTDTCAARLAMHPEVQALAREVLANRMRKSPTGALGRYLVPIWRPEQDAMMRLLRDTSPVDFPERVRGEQGGAQWHVFRHTFGTELVEGGGGAAPMSETKVQLLMRHASAESTRNYMAAIRGRNVPNDDLIAFWAAQESSINTADLAFSVDVKHESAPVSRLSVPEGRKE